MKIKKIQALIIILFSIFVMSGCSIETVAQHDSRIADEISSREALNSSQNTEDTSNNQFIDETSSDSTANTTAIVKQEDSTSKISDNEDSYNNINIEPTANIYEGQDYTSVSENPNNNDSNNKTTRKYTTSEKTTKNKSKSENKTKSRPTIPNNNSTPNTTKPNTESKQDDSHITVTVTIQCINILDNKNLNTSANIPSSGYYIENYSIVLDKGDNAYSALKYSCQANNIQLLSEYTPMFDSYYIYGVNNLLEKECGTYSGWKYSINNNIAGEGANNYVLSNKDHIELFYVTTY